MDQKPPDKQGQEESADQVVCGVETKPIDSLETLLSKWIDPPAADQPGDNNLVCYRIPKCIPRTSAKSSHSNSLTLLCHDMKGGYLEDRFNNGHTNRDAYRFFHWSLVDIFVYFSHHFITIPPIGWTVAAHRNGTKCFGTLIIEHWAEYSEDLSLKSSGLQLLSDLLQGEDRIDQVATAMTNLAVHYRFDGWLVNIEAPIPVPKIGLMEKFLRLLTAKTKKALQLGDDDIAVIWYDSVTTDNGKLDWQNELNAKNVSFFKACDGIFLNYCWNVGHLLRSRQLVETDPELAGKRNRIFVGVDIFGRGCLGGGGFASDVALAEIHKANLSVAIFAPGWTHEVLGPAQFDKNERRFWSHLVPYLPERRPAALPLCTTFCQGFGDRLYREGQLISPLSWYNLAEQQLQPSYQYSSTVDNFEQHCYLSTEEAFHGGSCLKFVLPVDGPEMTILRCAIPLQRTVQLSLTTKKSHHPSVARLVSNLAFRNIPEQLQLYSRDDDGGKHDQAIPALHSKLIKSISRQSAFIGGGWKRDEFKIKFHKHDELILTSINISIRLTPKSSQEEDDDDDEPLSYGHFEVLVGKLALQD